MICQLFDLWMVAKERMISGERPTSTHLTLREALLDGAWAMLFSLMMFSGPPSLLTKKERMDENGVVLLFTGWRDS